MVQTMKDHLLAGMVVLVTFLGVFSSLLTLVFLLLFVFLLRESIDGAFEFIALSFMALVVVFGNIFTGWLVVRANRAARVKRHLQRNGVFCWGQIAKVEQSPTTGRFAFTLLMQFTTNTGHQITTTTFWNGVSLNLEVFKVGMNLPLKYDPANPQSVMVDETTLKGMGVR